MSNPLPPRPGDQHGTPPGPVGGPHDPGTPPGPGSRPGTPARTRHRGLVVGVGVAAAVLLLGGGAWALVAATSDDAPSSMGDLVEQAVAAADDQDVDALLALVCDDSALLDLADEARDANDRVAEDLDGDDPDLTYDVEVDGDEATVRVESGADSLDGAFAEMVVTGEESDGGWCVSDVEVTDGAYDG